MIYFHRGIDFYCDRVVRIELLESNFYAPNSFRFIELSNSIILIVFEQKNDSDFTRIFFVIILPLKFILREYLMILKFYPLIKLSSLPLKRLLIEYQKQLTLTWK